MSSHFPVRGYGDALFDDLFDAQRIDFGFLEPQHKGKALEDPLPDMHFEPAHKKAERLERSIRNTEKGRAQHEKDQILRLLEGLQGHDWLRTMGVSGITESRKKTFEPARQHFIKGCQAILEKFRLWAVEEKRRKQEKERLLAEQAEEMVDGDGDEDEQPEEAEEEDASGPEGIDGNVDEGNDQVSDGDPPDYSDVDASIARQLHEEAAARSKPAGTNKSRPKKPRPKAAPQALRAQPQPQKEFRSFFRKKHERDAAMNRNRRGVRKVLAWGEQIPEIPESDFVLPEGYRDHEILKARARRKRRDKRGSRN
jgi:Something about silencing, SAS, complex subunit 4